MKKLIFEKTIIFVGVLFLVGAWIHTVYSWTGPQNLSNTTSAPIYTDNTPQKKSVYTGDVALSAPDTNTTLSLDVVNGGTSLNPGVTAGLFTQGFLARGPLPTFGRIFADLGLIIDTQSVNPNIRSPLQLFGGGTPSAEPMVNIVLSNIGGTNTKIFGVWSALDNAWANARVKNAHISNLFVTDENQYTSKDVFYRKSYYQLNGVTNQLVSSFTKRLLGYTNAINQDMYQPIPLSNTPPTCTTLGYGNKIVCTYASGHVYELVKPDSLDLAGNTKFGLHNNGNDECVVPKTAECPLGTYLVAIGAGPNNRCRAFSPKIPSACTPSLSPLVGIDETINGSGFGATYTGWVVAVPSGLNWNLMNLASACSASNFSQVASGGQTYIFSNPYGSPNGPPAQMTLQGGVQLVTPGTSMVDTMPAGVYFVLHSLSQPNNTNFNPANMGKFLLNISEAGIILNREVCP